MRSAMAIAVQLVNHEYRSHEPAGRMPRHKRCRDRKRFKVFQPREGPCLAGPSTWQRASGDIDAKLEQCAVYAGCTLERVSQAHIPDRPSACRLLEPYDAADRFPLMHQVEGLVDVLQGHLMGDHRIDLDLAVHIPVDNLGHIGAPARPTKGRAPPGAAGDELERPGGNFLPGSSHPDDNRLAPALVSTFERRAHHLHIADAFE